MQCIKSFFSRYVLMEYLTLISLLIYQHLKANVNNLDKIPEN